MVTGETLLKISNYPFVYSLFFLFSPIDENSTIFSVLPILSVVTIIGTFLIGVDPMGRIIKFLVKTRSKKLHNVKEIEWRYVQSAYNTNTINVEKDKILNMIYFAFVIIIFLVMMYLSEDFTDRFSTILDGLSFR